VVNGKTIRFLPCFLLATLVVVQAAQIAPHTCLGNLALSADDTADTVPDTAPEPEDGGRPICVACALASQCGAAHLDPAPTAVPPVLEGWVVGDTPAEAGSDLAAALVPRPPPPSV